MNFLLTSAWFSVMTYLGYAFAPEGKEVGFAVAFLGLALIVRLIVWAVSGTSYSGSSYSSSTSSGTSDSGFFSFFDGGSSNSGSSDGGGCSGGCSGSCGGGGD